MGEQCGACDGDGMVWEWVGTWTGLKSSPMMGSKPSRKVKCKACNGTGAKDGK